MNHEPQTTITIVTSTARETRQLGRLIGRHLEQPTIIRLLGDLGSGKTCFVQGLARGLQVPDGYDVTSPTYSLVHEYPGRLPLVHIDLYRIHDEMDAENIGMGEILGRKCVAAVEWADRLSDDYWPVASTMAVELQNTADGKRHVRLFGYGLQNSVLIKKIGTLVYGTVSAAE